MVNNLGVDPTEWFDSKSNPLDSMPIAKKGDDLPPRPEEEIAAAFDWEDTAPSEYEPPHDESDDIEATKTLHQKMYEMATENGTTITMGGSENASRV